MMELKRLVFGEPLPERFWGFIQIPCEIRDSENRLLESYTVPVKEGYTQRDLYEAYDCIAHSVWRAKSHLLFGRDPEVSVPNAN